MALIDKEDWKEWLNKLKWQIISFKFLSFWVAIILLVSVWFSLERLHNKSVKVATDLYKADIIEKGSVTTIITHSQTTLYSSALSHILIFAGACITGIFAIKGVSYYTDSKQAQTVINKINGDATKEDLKKFLPKKGK